MSIFFRKHRSKAAKIAGIAFFALLMFVNIQVTTNPSKSGDINLLGLKFSLITPSASALDYDNPPTGGGGTLHSMVSIRTDVWTCYHLESIQILGNTIFCNTIYQVSVNTESCQGPLQECTPGTWRWNPNPPCGGDATSDGGHLRCDNWI